jgi:hypothetical protein
MNPESVQDAATKPEALPGVSPPGRLQDAVAELLEWSFEDIEETEEAGSLEAGCLSCS